MVGKCLGREMSGSEMSGREMSGRKTSWNHIGAQNGHFKAFLNRQEGNEEYSKMDETHVTSTVYHCHSDDNTFRELLGHLEIKKF